MADSWQAVVAWVGWNAVAAVAAILAFAGMVVYNQHAQLIAQVKNEGDRTRIREKLATDAGIARRFRDGIDALITGIDRYFGPRLGWRAFDRCLLHAYLYPSLLFVAAWVAGAGGALGYIRLLPDADTAQRVWIFAILVLLVGWGFIVTASIPRIESLLQRGISRVLELATSAIGRSTRRAASRIVAILVGAVAGAAAVAGVLASVGAVGSVGADGGTIAFGVGVVVIVACAAGIAAVGAVAIVLGVGVVAIVVNFGPVAGDLKPLVTIVTLFIALPVANAVIDWLSWTWTRLLLRRPTDGERATRSATGITARLLVDFGLAFVSLCLLALLLPHVVEAANRFFGWHDLPMLGWLPLLSQALDAPFSQGLFITGMLLTTLIPTLLHVAAGLFGVFAVWGGGGPAMAARIPVDASAPMAESDCQTVAWYLLCRRLWLIPAIVATVLLVLPLAWLLSLLIGPIGLFLADLALCGTSWSHGLCPFWD